MNGMIIPVVKQLRKYMNQSCEMCMIRADRLCSLLHESWTEFCKKNDLFPDGSSISHRTTFALITWNLASYFIIFKFFCVSIWALPILGVSLFS